MAIRVNKRPVASHYALPGETIIEYGNGTVGGLISFREGPDGKLIVDLYRHDQDVDIRVGKADDA